MRRRELIRDLRAWLDGRQLVWFGTRGDDVEAVTELPELAAVFSVINAYDRRSSIVGMAFEDLTGRRVDLDRHDIDEELGTEEMVTFRRAILRTLSRSSALFTYRPSTLVSAVCFARRDRCTYLGMFKDHQSAFEHKPWLESGIAELGVPHIPWTYVADEDQLETLRFLNEGPVMLRRSRTSGGTGLVKVDSAAALEAAWPEQEEAYVSVAPFLADGVPINVGGVVWADGVTLHPASLQLIGLEEFTGRPFGYCGNDFGAVRDLDAGVLAEIDAATERIGRWLGGLGYRGAFGLDFLVVDGRALFTEVNPRFQGSTHASSQVSVQLEESCILLEHLAANVGLPSPPSRTLEDLARDVGELSHFVVHHRPGDPAPSGLGRLVMDQAPTMRVDVIAPDGLQLDDGATLLRATVAARTTADGFSIDGPWDAAVRKWRTSDPNDVTTGAIA